VNDAAFVERVMDLLRRGELEPQLVGGWADELSGGADPRPHSDVDVRCDPALTSLVDALIAELGLDELLAKRRPGKRAFVLDGVLVEIHLR
jgi:hypothetical protein